MSEPGPSEALQTETAKAIVSALAKSVNDWDVIDELTQPFYRYITRLLNNQGARSFLLSDDETDELTIGVEALDDDGYDSLLASNQFNFSDVLEQASMRDPGHLENLIAAAEKSLTIARARLKAMESTD